MRNIHGSAGIRALGKYAWLLYPISWPYQDLADAGLERSSKHRDMFSLTLAAGGIAAQLYTASGWSDEALGHLGLYAYLGLTFIHATTCKFPLVQFLLLAYPHCGHAWMRAVGWYPRFAYALWKKRVPVLAKKHCVLAVLLVTGLFVLNALLLLEKPEAWVYALPLLAGIYLFLGYLMDREAIKLGFA